MTDVHNDTILTLSSKDGETFQVPYEVAKLSDFLVNSFEPQDDEDDDEPLLAEKLLIPVPNVAGDVLSKVVDFMNHFMEEPMTPIQTPLRSNVLAELVQAWYADFVKVPRNMLFDLVAAANFMDIKPLLDLTCLATSILIKGKSAEELREMFNISAELSPEEEAANVEAQGDWVASEGANKEAC